MDLRRVLGMIVVVAAAGCGQNATEPATTGPARAAPGPPSAPAVPRLATTVRLIEPGEGAMGGHIDTFRWEPVDGADSYVIRIVAVTGDRVVWESAPMAGTETKLPPTVGLEPQGHT